MEIDLAALPDDVETLHHLIGDLVAARENERAEARAEIDRLRHIVKLLQRNRFGRRSERLDNDQMLLGLEDVDTHIARAEISLPQSSTAKPRAQDNADQPPGLPDHLEREDVHLDIDAETCPDCGGAIHHIGETVSEMLDWVPARLRVIRTRRPRYGCRACGTVHQAPALERPIAKGLASPRLLAHVLVSKYCDHQIPVPESRTPALGFLGSSALGANATGLLSDTDMNGAGKASWLAEFQREICLFPNRKHDN